jgi:hypothetical protein
MSFSKSALFSRLIGMSTCNVSAKWIRLVFLVVFSAVVLTSLPVHLKYNSVHAQSVSFVNPTINQSPDPGQGGLAVNNQTNLGHGDTNVQASGDGGGGNISQTKTGLWHSFTNVSGLKTRVTLKFDWAQTGSIGVQNWNLGDNSSADTTLSIDYSTDNGANWTTQVSRYHFRFVIFGPGNDSELISDSGSESVDLPNPNTINITQIRVRDRIVAAASLSGSGYASANVTMHISNIRLEVETDTTPPVISSVSAGSTYGHERNHHLDDK